MAVCSPAKEKRGFNATCAAACAGRAMLPPPIISIAGEYAGFKTTLRRTAMQDATPGNGKNLPEKTSTDADITKCGQVVQSDACAHHHCGERIIHHKNGQ